MRLVVQHSIPEANLDQSSSFLILSRTSAVLARRWGKCLFSLSPLNRMRSPERKRGSCRWTPSQDRFSEIVHRGEGADPQPSSPILKKGVGCLFSFPNKN